MKKALLILGMAVASAFSASAQIVNGGFENWSGDVLNDWTVVGGRAIQASVVTYIKSGDTIRRPVYDGQFAVLLSGVNNSPGRIDQQFPITTTPRYIGGSYAFFPVLQGEKAAMRIVIYNSTTRDTNLNVVLTLNANPTEPWGSFNGDFQSLYKGTGTPDSGLIQIFPTIGNGAQLSLATQLILGSVNLSDNLFTEVREASMMKASVNAYPNPTRGNATITYTLSNAANVSLAVYDLNGREVIRLAEGMRPAGSHQVPFDGLGLEKGMYIFRLKAGDVVETGKLILAE